MRVYTVVWYRFSGEIFLLIIPNECLWPGLRYSDLEIDEWILFWIKVKKKKNTIYQCHQVQLMITFRGQLKKIQYIFLILPKKCFCSQNSFFFGIQPCSPLSTAPSVKFQQQQQQYNIFITHLPPTQQGDLKK